MEMLNNILAYGYLFIAGSVFLFMVIQILAFYIAGRVTGSIDDEVSSAFTLFGAMLVIGSAGALINAGIGIFLDGLLVPGVISSVLSLIAVIYAIAKTYELSAGSSILFLLLSLVITAVLTGGIIYGAGKLMPESGITLNMPGTTEEDAGPGMTETAAEAKTGNASGENTIENTEVMVMKDKNPVSPKLPEQVSAAEKTEECSDTKPCKLADELCLGAVCYTEDDIRNGFIIDSSDCSERTCESCEEGRLENLTVVVDGGKTLDICIDCGLAGPDGLRSSCKEGYSCLGYKCVAD